MNETFQTSDLLMAAFLQAREHELLELRPNGEGKAVFIFRDEDEIRQSATEFLQDAAIPVRTLARRIARLRSRCRELRRQSGPMQTRMNVRAEKICP